MPLATHDLGAADPLRLLLYSLIDCSWGIDATLAGMVPVSLLFSRDSEMSPAAFPNVDGMLPAGFRQALGRALCVAWHTLRCKAY